MDFVGTAVAADAVADHSVWWMMIQKHEQNFTLMVMMMVIYDYSDNDNNGGDDGDNDSALCIMILRVE